MVHVADAALWVFCGQYLPKSEVAVFALEVYRGLFHLGQLVRSQNHFRFHAPFPEVESNGKSQGLDMFIWEVLIKRFCKMRNT